MLTATDTPSSVLPSFVIGKAACSMWWPFSCAQHEGASVVVVLVIARIRNNPAAASAALDLLLLARVLTTSSIILSLHY